MPRRRSEVGWLPSFTTTSVNAWHSWHSAWKTRQRHYRIFQERRNNNSTNFSIQPASLERIFKVSPISCIPPPLKVWDLSLELALYAKNSATGMGSRLIFRPKTFQGMFLQMLLCVCSVLSRKRFRI